MLVMFSVGVASLVAMAALTGLMVHEKTQPGGRRLVPVAGAPSWRCPCLSRSPRSDRDASSLDWPAVAVPKQRQSHARTNKRRSQHKISPPSLRACPNAASRGCRIASA